MEEGTSSAIKFLGLVFIGLIALWILTGGYERARNQKTPFLQHSQVQNINQGNAGYQSGSNQNPIQQNTYIIQ